MIMHAWISALAFTVLAALASAARADPCEAGERASCTLAANGPGGRCSIAGEKVCDDDGRWGSCAGQCTYTDRAQRSKRCCRTVAVRKTDRRYDARKKKRESYRRTVHERQCKNESFRCQRTVTCRAGARGPVCTAGSWRCDEPRRC